MSDSCSPLSTTGRAIRRKLKRGAKYNHDFAQVAARMAAAGLGINEIGKFLGVKPATITKWKERYEEFRNAHSNGKEIAKQYLVANGLRAAMGYDYEEVEEDWLPDKETGKMVCVKRKVKLRHKPVDSALLIFFLINMSGGEFKNVRNVEINEKSSNLNVDITGQLESDQIRQLAGKLNTLAKNKDKTKQVMSKTIDDLNQ